MEITFDVLMVLYAELHPGDIKRTELSNRKSLIRGSVTMLRTSFIIRAAT
jgi:hypothetical protein